MTAYATPRRVSGTTALEGEEYDHAQARAQLVAALERAMVAKGMTQVQTARLLGTDQPTLSKVLRGRTASISLDKLVSWLLVLGRSVEIRVYEAANSGRARLTSIVQVDADV